MGSDSGTCTFCSSGQCKGELFCDVSGISDRVSRNPTGCLVANHKFLVTTPCTVTNAQCCKRLQFGHKTVTTTTSTSRTELQRCFLAVFPSVLLYSSDYAQFTLCNTSAELLRVSRKYYSHHCLCRKLVMNI